MMIMDSKSNRKGRGNRKGNGKHHDRHPRVIQTVAVPQLQSAEVFPPLVSTSVPKPAPIDVKYSKEEICEIVKGVKDLSCPPLATSNIEDVVSDGEYDDDERRYQ